jgi:hypothetical protein
MFPELIMTTKKGYNIKNGMAKLRANHVFQIGVNMRRTTSFKTRK